MLRRGDLEAAKRDVLHHLYHDGGSGLSPSELWPAIDAANRRRDGEYKQHAGYLPRLATFIVASFPYGADLAGAINVLERFVGDLNKTYGVAWRR